MSSALRPRDRLAKSPVTGPTLPTSLELTDGATLANVWRGAFIGAPAIEPDPTWARYVVAFYVEPPRQPVQMMYSVMYVKSPTTGEGFIYLPGKGEDGWRRNVMTILRNSQDGKWHRAASDWSRAIGARLPVR